MVRWLLGIVLATALGGAGEAEACDATRVRDGAVRAGPFVGYITPDYDVVDGRFRLHTGRWRDRDTGLSQKIPWFVRRSARVGRRLRVTGKRISPSPSRFTQVLRRTGGGSRYVFPSILAPPSEGCWRLRFVSGETRGRLTVLVRD